MEAKVIDLSEYRRKRDRRIDLIGELIGEFRAELEMAELESPASTSPPSSVVPFPRKP